MADPAKLHEETQGSRIQILLGSIDSHHWVSFYIIVGQNGIRDGDEIPFRQGSAFPMCEN